MDFGEYLDFLEERGHNFILPRTVRRAERAVHLSWGTLIILHSYEFLPAWGAPLVNGWSFRDRGIRVAIGLVARVGWIVVPRGLTFTAVPTPGGQSHPPPSPLRADPTRPEG
jgi:hypothetical protein